MLAIVDSEKNQILHYFLERFESPITVMQLFNIHKKTVDIDNILSGFFLKINAYSRTLIVQVFCSLVLTLLAVVRTAY